MDPLTLFALANGAVKLVKEGCKLYKDIKGAAGDIKDVLKDLDDQFHTAHKDRPPTVAEQNQYIAEKNRVISLNKQAGDTSNIYTEIGEQLGVYFDNLFKCYAIFEEEERRSRTEVYHGEDSIGKRALQRVLLRKQLDAMRAELREIMVYQSPPELGALWTEVEAMMENSRQRTGSGNWYRNERKCRTCPPTAQTHEKNQAPGILLGDNCCSNALYMLASLGRSSSTHRTFSGVGKMFAAQGFSGIQLVQQSKMDRLRD